MIEGSFFAMGETESFVHILKTNHEAFEYNTSLGYEMYQEEKEFVTLKMTPESFLRKTKKLRKAIHNLYGKSNLEIVLEPIDYQLGYAFYFRDIIHKIPDKYVVKLDETNNSIKLILNIESDLT